MRSVLITWLERHGLPGWFAPDYMMMVGIAALLGAAVTMRLSERDGANTRVEKRALLATYVGALVGGYVFEWLRVLPEAIATLSWGPFLHVGRAAYGGFLGGTLCAIVVLRRGGAEVRPFLDRTVPLCGLSYGFVRVGCFLAGCDYGKPTASVWGMRFPAGSPPAVDHASLGWITRNGESLPVHATQLYEAAIGVIAAGIASLWLVKGKRDGRVFATFVVLYAVGRFFVETLRGDGSRGMYGAVSTAQWVSIGLVVAVGVFVWHAKRESRRTLTAVFAASMLLATPSFANAQSKTGTGSSAPLPVATSSSSNTPSPAPPPAPPASSSAPNIPPPPPVPGAQPYPPQPGAQPYPYPYPYPPLGAPPPQKPANDEQPPTDEADDLKADHQKALNARRLGIGLALGLYIVPRFGVSNGGTIDFDAAWRVQVSTRGRFEFGLGGTFVMAGDATIGGVSIPLRFVSGVSRRTEVEVAVAPFYSRIRFDSKYFEPENLIGARFQVGIGWALNSHFQLGLSPIVVGIMGSSEVKTLFTYEPKFWVRVAAL